MASGTTSEGATARPTSTTSSILSISDRMDLDEGDDFSLRSTNLNNRSSSCSSSTMNRNSKDVALARTTTISTIAMESHSSPTGSGSTKSSPCRLVIALLQTPHQALQLKIIDLSPNLLKLPDSLKDAEEFLTNHNQVIKNLQSKQSPVEELLRQADNLISTQKPRAEVYAAMADSLGHTWKDLNTLLEERKTVINLAVIVHTNIAICTEKINQVHNEYSKISYLPNEDFTSSATVTDRLKKLKNDRLEILKLVSICLDSSDKLLNKIAGFNYSIDSRELFLLRDVEIANKQVHRWLERLHDRRMILEDKLKVKKEQFEEYLDYIDYDIEIQKLDEKLESLRGFDKNFDYGHSVATCQIKRDLLETGVKDMKTLQEKSLLTAKKLEDSQQAQRSKFYQRSTLKVTLYKILEEVNDLLTESIELELGLSESKEFFRLAEEALAKLESVSAKDPMVLSKSELNNITEEALAKGQSVLDANGWDTIRTNGVRAVHDNLIRRKTGLIDEIDHLQILDEYNHFLEYVNQSYQNLLNVESSTLRQPITIPVDSPQVFSFKQTHESTLEELSQKLNFDHLLTQLEKIYPNLSEEEKLETEEKINQLKFLSNLIVELIIQRVFIGGEWSRILELYENLQSELSTVGNQQAQQSASKERLENVLDQVIGTYSNIQEQLDEVHRSDPDLNTSRMELKIEEIIKELQLKLEALAVNDRSRSICQIYKVKLDRHLLGYLDDGVFVSSSYFPVLNEQDAAFSPSSATSSVLSTNSSSGPALNIIRDRVQDKLDSVLDRFLDPLIKDFRQDISKLQLNPSLSVIKPTKEEEDLVKYYNRLKESYVTVSKEVLSYLRELHLVNQEIDEKFNLNPKTLEQVETSLSQLNASYNEINKKISEGLNKHLDSLLDLVVREEPPVAADKEAKILKAMTTKITKEKLQTEFLNRQETLSQQLSERMVDADLDLINKQLNDLIDELEQPCSYGDCLTDAQAYLANFARFEKTVEVLKEKLTRLVGNATLTDNEKARNLSRKLNELLDKKVKRRELILLSLEYFRLIQVSKEHYTRINGSLQTITEKSNNLAITKEQIEDLLKQLEAIKSKEQEQEERLVEIERISSVLFGPMESYLGNTQHEPLKRENNSMTKEIHYVETSLNDLLNSFKRRSKSTETQTSQVPTPAVSPAPVHKPIMETSELSSTMTHITETSTLSSSLLRVQSPLPPSGSPLPPIHKLEKETQIEFEEEAKVVDKLDRDTITQTMEERNTSAQTQTDALHVTTTSTTTEAIMETEMFRVGSAVPSVVLEEYLAPTFIQPLKDLVVNEGDRVVLECKTTGEIKKLQWLKDGLEISNNPDYKTEFLDNSLAKLTIDEVFHEDSAIFTCRASGGDDDSVVVETSGKLTVREPTTTLLQAPKFLQHAGKSSGVHGNPHTLQLRIEGNPLPTVQWFKNGVCIDTSPDYIITFNNGLCEVQFDELLKELDDGVYSCVGVNKLGQCETKIELDIKGEVPKKISRDPPRWIRPLPKNVMTRAGQKLKVDCEFESATDCNIMWVKDDLKILTKNNSSAEIRSTRSLATLIYNEAYPLNSGKYTVLIRNAGGEIQSETQVVVKGLLPAETSDDSELNTSDIEIVKPLIKMPLKDAHALMGDSLRLDCVIVGHPEPEVIWYKNSTPLKESPNHHLLFHGDKCSLIIHKVDSNDRGMYSVSAINNGGEATSKCQVLIYEKESDEKEEEEQKVEPPKFTQLIQDQMVTAGEAVEFSCEVSCDSVTNQPPEVTWWKNNQRFETTDDLEVTQHENKYSIRIKDVQPPHRGNYMVKAKNAGGDAKCFACLIVKENLEQQQKPSPAAEPKPAKLSEARESPPLQQRKLSLPKAAPRAPRFTKPLEGRMVDEGKTNISLKCIVDANPPAEIKWTRNNSTEPLIASETSNFEMKYIEKSGEVELVIKTVNISNGGRYNCTATNDGGIASSIADLVVKKTTFPPVLSKRLQSITVDEGKRIYLEIDVFAKPSPKITWELNGLEIKPGADPTITMSSDSPTRYSLVVNEAVPTRHRGQYKVTAKNESGEASSTCTVNIMERPGSQFDDFSVSSVPSPIPIPIPVEQKQETTVSSITHFPIETTIIPPPRLSISNQGQPEQIIVQRKEEETKTIIHSTTTITSSQNQQLYETSSKSISTSFNVPDWTDSSDTRPHSAEENIFLVPGPEPEILMSPSPTSWAKGRNQVQEKVKTFQEQIVEGTETTIPPSGAVRIIPIVEQSLKPVEKPIARVTSPVVKYEPKPIQLPLFIHEDIKPKPVEQSIPLLPTFIPKSEELKPARLPVIEPDEIKHVVAPPQKPEPPTSAATTSALRESFFAQEFASSSSYSRQDLPWAADSRDIRVIKPSKFVPEKLRESDYESDFESSVILPKWVPPGSSTEPSPVPPTSAFVPVTSTPSSTIKTFPTGTSTVYSEKSFEEFRTSEVKQKPIVPPKPKLTASPLPPEVPSSSPLSPSFSPMGVRGLAKTWPPLDPSPQVTSQTTTSTTTQSKTEKDTTQYLSMPPAQSGGMQRLSPIQIQVPERSRSPTPNKEALEMDRLWARPIRFSSPCTVGANSPREVVNTPSPQPPQKMPEPVAQPQPLPVTAPAPKPIITPVKSPQPPQTVPQAFKPVVPPMKPTWQQPVAKEGPVVPPKPVTQPVSISIVQTRATVLSPSPKSPAQRYYVSVVSTPRTTPVPPQMTSPTPDTSSETPSFHDKREFFEQSSSFSSKEESFVHNTSSSNSKSYFHQTSSGGSGGQSFGPVPKFHALFDETLLPPPGEPPVFLYAPPPTTKQNIPPGQSAIVPAPAPQPSSSIQSQSVQGASSRTLTSSSVTTKQVIDQVTVKTESRNRESNIPVKRQPPVTTKMQMAPRGMIMGSQTLPRKLPSMREMYQYIKPKKFIPAIDYASSSDKDYLSDQEGSFKPKWTPGVDEKALKVYKKVKYEPRRSSLTLVVDKNMQDLNKMFKSNITQMSQGLCYNNMERKIQSDLGGTVPTSEKEPEEANPLIYFKYDFGYEFGIAQPKTESDANKKERRLSLPSSSRSDKESISLPIIHEKTTN